MTKKKKNNNALIKLRGLINELHKRKIERVNKRALKCLIKNFEKDIARVIDIISRELTLRGKKTLEVRDIKEIFEKLKEKEEAWEI